MRISRRKLLAFAAGATIAPKIPVLPIDDGIAITSMAHPITIGYDITRVDISEGSLETMEEAEFTTENLLYKTSYRLLPLVLYGSKGQ